VEVSDAELTALVQAEIEALMAQGENFTAYDVTRRLRENNPSLDIPHYDRTNSGRATVQILVRDLMRPFTPAPYNRMIDGSIAGQPYRWFPVQGGVAQPVAATIPAGQGDEDAEEATVVVPQLTGPVAGDDSPNAGSTVEF
jgi:hypothetical protein